MGGKALNKYGVTTVRKNTEEFRRIGIQLQYKVKMTLNLESEVVTCYHTKADHGDLDLLISVPSGRGINWNEYIHERFHPRAVNSNGGVHSFDYEDFQIDFILVQQSKWNTARTYYSYDPLGNIMGKTYHKFGMSYGWDGLFYKYRNPHGSNSANILLSNDAKKIFDFGGYNYDRYLLGFDVLEEIFDFAIASKYFDTEMFQMENLKSLDKKRNRKRGSYHLFLNYLKDNNINTVCLFDENKSNYIKEIDAFFPEAKLLDKLEELKAKDARDNELRMKFNGDIVMEWLPNLQGKELGNAMGKFKIALGGHYEDFILTCSYAELQKSFMEVYNGEK